MLRAVHELPGLPGAPDKGRERLLSTRGSPVGFRAPRGEDTSEPVPRQRRGRAGMSGQGFESPMLQTS